MDFPTKNVIFHSYVSLPEGILNGSFPMGMSGRWFVSDLELRTVEVIGAAVLNVFVPDLMATESTASDVGSGIRFKPSP